MKKIVLFISLLFVGISNIKAIETSATSAILMDTDSNRIIYSKNIHEVRSVASISKIMTAIVAIENTDINKKVKVTNVIKKAYGSGIYIKEGEELLLKDLLYGLMLRSGNDAALMIANTTSKTTEDFVKLMNEMSTKLNMKQTTFNNPSGLDEEKGNFSTAYDMALLMSYAIKNSTFKKIVSTKKYTLKTNMNTYIWHNKNKLLFSYKNITGGKTGYTEIARRTLVTTASKDNLNLVVVTLNDGNDWDDHKDLFEYGFKTFKSYEILKEGKIEVENDNYYKDYELYLKENFKYPLLDSEKNNIVVKIELEKDRKLEENTKVGTAVIYLGEEKIGSKDIYMKEKEQPKEKNLITKIKEWFKNIW